MLEDRSFVSSLTSSSYMEVKVVGDTVVVEVFEIHLYFKDSHGIPMIKTHERVFTQKFDLVGVPWRPEENLELFADLIRDRIKEERFKMLAEAIASLAQRFVADQDVCRVRAVA